MKEIGGYFSSEALIQEEFNYHPGLLQLNSGRNGLEYIILANGLTKIYLPAYSCSVLLEPFRRHAVEYEYYPINNNLEPVFDFSIVKHNEAAIVINYFGMIENYLFSAVKDNRRIIVDNSQAFFSRNYGDVGTFYSARKFFGVSDGAFVDSPNKLNIEIPKDQSQFAIGFPEIREKSGARAGYPAFLLNEQNLSKAPIMTMSERTKDILSHLNFESIIASRKLNYSFYEHHLSRINLLDLVYSGEGVPMYYPLLLNRNASDLKIELAKRSIFIPTYWPDVEAGNCSFEHQMVNNLLCLPIDHRYSTVDLKLVLESLTELMNI